MHVIRKLATTLAIGAILGSGAMSAWADAQSEAFVEKNANMALDKLNDKALTSDKRTEEFSKLMDKFADMNRLTRFVVGRYGRTFSENDFADYQEAYRKYAMAVYEVQLDQFRGDKIEVIDSKDLRPGDSVVRTRIYSSDQNKDLMVEWRVQQDKTSSAYKVLDVALDIDGSRIWLAQEQQAQFTTLLDRSNGDVNALIERINSMTEGLISKKEVSETAEISENNEG